MKAKGLTNKYSLELIWLMGFLLIFGGWLIFKGDLWGFIPLILGGLMFLGLYELSGSNPKEIGLMTVLGKRTDVTVEGLILLLKVLGIEIIGVTVFNMQQEDMDFPVENIRALDKVRMKGTASMSFVPDEANLANFDDAKQMKGIRSLIDDMIPVWIQALAKGDPEKGIPGKDHEWLETNSLEIGKYLLAKLANVSPADGDLNDLAGLGVKIKKISVKLVPISTKIIDAGEQSVIEDLQRESQLKDTLTVGQRAIKRREDYVKSMGEDKAPNLAKCRDEVIFETLVADGKVQISQGGRLVNLKNVGNTDKPEKGD